jgi:hypothetical protein
LLAVGSHAGEPDALSRDGGPIRAATQPGDTSDFAHYLTECVDDGPRGDCDAFGAPEVLSLGKIVKQHQAARGVHRPIWRVPLPRAARRVTDALICPQGRRGDTTWSAWLSRQAAA